MKNHILAALLILPVLVAACTNTEKAPAGVEVQLQNPIIPGFHPDPSVVAVGEDYYIVNSTFHYFPGVPVYHSRDLQNWEQIGNVLDRPSQLPLEQSSVWLGIYAPTIRYHDGTFYMITTNVGNGGNFMVTATNPAGPWSEPVWLEQQGIDPSLYFEDGKCYMVSNPNSVITLCEIDPATGATLSPGKALWRGTGGRFPEGPHIYKRDGWYYLLISEGGTELAHKLTVARSRNIYGPYEANPANPIFTHCSLAAQDSNIQGTGHADFFQASDGSWWTVFLAYRRYGGDYHHLGRETFLAPVSWEKGWPVVNGGKPVAERMKVRMPAQPKAPQPARFHEDFSAIGPQWMHIQHPIADNYSARAGVLTLKGNGDGFDWGGWHPTALLMRQQDADCQFGSTVRLIGEGEAGIALYQSDAGHVEFFVRRGRAPEAVVRVRLHSLLHEEAVVPLKAGEARLDVRAWGDHYEFLLGGREIARVDSKLLSTEMAGGFTGITIGPYCRSGRAEFDGFDYSALSN
ncbi:MAG: family 43 glycosylhydrolase [Bacteroidales bacterium]|nr:family 43 glycosylhydrolase [Bacteroidales bacterium]